VPNGTPLGQSAQLQWDSWFGINLRGMICVEASGGFRKAELSLPANAEFDAMCMSRASLFWVIDGAILRCPSDAQLRALKAGDQAGLLACPAKNDPWGLEFVPHPLFFNFVPGVMDNTAGALRDLVLKCPVPPERMRATPLFSMGPAAPGGGQKPLRHAFMDKVLRCLLLTFLSAERANLYSWHSFRIGLACALLAAGAPESIILALCRWKSAASLRIYARLNRNDSAAWLDAAATQQINSVQAPNLASFASVPGALQPHVYEYLAQVEQHPGPSAADLLALNGQRPEIDGDSFFGALGHLRVTDPEEENAPGGGQAAE